MALEEKRSKRSDGAREAIAVVRGGVAAAEVVAVVSRWGSASVLSLRLSSYRSLLNSFLSLAHSPL